MPSAFRSEAAAVGAVAAGGSLGALARFGIDVVAGPWGATPPWATLLVNLLGCALMGLLVAYVLAHPGRHPLWRPFLGVGFLGGFTTFSAFAGDAVQLAEAGAWGWSTAYVIASVAGCLLALRVAYAAGHALRQRRVAR